MKNDWLKVQNILKNDGVVVIPTDTLYGIIARAQSKKAIERIYKIKGRDENKPFIVLISSFKDLDIFGVKIDKDQAKFLKKIWPGKVSVILPCELPEWDYIHRATKTIAFRMISKKNIHLLNLIKNIGPLVAPSANTQGEQPAETISKAKEYFEDNVDYYINKGKRISEPSTLISIIDKEIKILRQGKVKININKK